MNKFLVALSTYRFVMAAIFAAVGFFCHLIDLEIANGVTIYFSGVFVVLSLLFLGSGYGLISAILLSISSRIAFQNEPIILMISFFEVLFLSIAYKKSKSNSLLISDSWFWLLIGMPCSFFISRQFLNLNGSETIINTFKTALNGMINVLTAEILFLLFTFFKVLKLQTSNNQTSLNKIFFLTFSGLILIPSSVFLILLLQNESDTIENLKIILQTAIMIIYAAIVFLSYLSKRFASPFSGLIKAINSASLSDKKPWPLFKIKEFNNLVSELNSYKDSIYKNIDELNEFNKNLENKFRLRTIDLAKSEERYRSFFEKNQAVMILVDSQDGKIIDANDAASTFYGWTIQELKEKFIYEINIKTKEDSHDDFHQTKKSDVKYFQVKHKVKNGFIKDVEVYNTTILINNHPVLFSIIHDISDRVRAEKVIEEQRSKLIASDRLALLGEMAGGIAHEINNPLAIIFGNTEQILKSIEGNSIDKKILKESAEKIHGMVKRISKIIKGMKNISRNADSDPLIAVSLSQVIDDTLQLSHEILKMKKIEVRFKPNFDLFVDCRPSELSQVFLNLISNSTDAIENLSEKWIEISIFQNANTAIIQFTDSGNGIPSSVVEKMMNPFFTTKDVGKGTGLGLSISHGIIKNHNGSIRYDLTRPHTTFIIELPLSSAESLAA